MNFFSRKNKIMISLETEDIEKEPQKLRRELTEVFPLNSGNEVLLSLKAIDDLPVQILNLVFSFSKEVKKQKAKIILNIKPNLNQRFKAISAEEHFDSILIEET